MKMNQHQCQLSQLSVCLCHLFVFLIASDLEAKIFISHISHSMAKLKSVE